MRVRIVNHKKFRRRMILVVFIICCILFNIKNTASSEAKIEYKNFTVSSGDTLWSIAKQQQDENAYYKDMDIREIMSDIKDINNLKTSNLTVEQKLKIPTKL